MQKQQWEHLTVQFSDGNPTHSHAVPLPVIALINGKSTPQNQPIHELTSELGRDGWEMLGTLKTEELFCNYLFFKRPATEQSTTQKEGS